VLFVDDCGLVSGVCGIVPDVYDGTPSIMYHGFILSHCLGISSVVSAHSCVLSMRRVPGNTIVYRVFATLL
jgi:uncharacterized membrane protein YwaF